MTPFAFMRPTPSWVRQSKDGGQYNGYIAIPKEYTDRVFRTVDWGDGWTEEMFCGSGLEEATLTQWSGMKSMGTFIPVTPIPDDWREGDYVVVGFDTLHVGDTWEECDFDAVKQRTIAWFVDTLTKIYL